jgi:glycosyltransferase involved in cell wall biosynthesis
MDAPPLLSVIIPSKNGKLEILGLLESIDGLRRAVNGHADNRVQLIIQDAMSTDGTAEIVAARLSEGDVLAVENDGGLYDAMNRGVMKARGEWLMFMGVDDRIIYKPLCEVLSAVADPRVELVVAQSVKSTGEPLASRWNWRMLCAHSVNHQACIYRRTVFRRYRYPTQFKLGGDYWLNLKLFTEGACVKRVPHYISQFGVQGMSSVQKELGEREAELVRRQVLGWIATPTNLALRLKRRLLRRT